MEIEVNYLAVLAVTLLSIALGMAWYSPLFIGRKWIRAMREQQPDFATGEGSMSQKEYGLSALIGLVSSFVLAHFISLIGADSFVEGATVGFWVWLGFSAAFQYSSVLYEKRNFQVYLFYTIYNLIWLLLAGGILAVW